MQPTNATYPTDSLPMLHDNQASYNFTWSPNGAGGVNYFSNGTPITREQFAISGQDPGAIEASAAQQYAGSTSSTGTSNTAGGGGGTTTDPYSTMAGKLYTDQKNNFQGSINTAIGSAQNQLGGTIQDYINSLRGEQTKIDRQGQQNELSKQVGTRGVLDMVGQGIRSGGVMLANKNASDSSATGALASAYGQLGRSQLSGVGNQYAQAENARANAQTDLGIANTNQMGTFQRQKTDVVNNIVSQAQDALNKIDQAAVYASLPDRVNMEQQKQQIRDQAMSALSQLDQQLSQGISGVTPTSVDANRLAANGLANAGTAPETAFNFNQTGPAQLQGSPFASEFPLFTLGRNRQTA